MSVKAIDLRRGMAVEYKDGIWVCQKNEKVAKGNWRSYQVVQLKNLATGQLAEDRFRTDEQFEQAMVDRKPMEYLYSESTGHIMMDPETFEQISIDDEMMGDQRVYLQPNITVTVTFVEGQPVSVELPNAVELKVVDTPPEVKGATATNQLKDAVCEGGARIKVPPFVNNGQIVKVDTRTGEYLGRA